MAESILLKAAKQNYNRLKPRKGITLAELKRKMSDKVSFIWRDRLPAKMLTLLSAREGIGKTTTALAIAKEVLETHPESYVIWIAAEGIETTIQQANWLGLDYEDRFIIATNEEDGFSFNFAQFSNLKRLEAILNDYEPVILVVIDCLSAVSPFDDKDQQTGKLLYKLNDVCQKAGATCLVLHHDKKGQASTKLDKISGTTQILRAARLILKLEPVKGTSLKRKIIAVKSNLLQKIEPIELVKTSQGLIFYEPTEEDEQTARDRCEEMLVELFTRHGGELPANFVYEQAEEHGISQETLKRVKASLGIKSEKRGKTWVWIWPLYKGCTLDTLPGNPHGSRAKEECQEEVKKEGCQECQECQDGQVGFCRKIRHSSQNSYQLRDRKEDGQDSYSFLRDDSLLTETNKEEELVL